MSLVVLIRIFRLFLESNILGIEVISDFKCLSEDPWKFRRVRDEKTEKKSLNSCLTGPGALRLKEPYRTGSVRQALVHYAS